MLSPVEIILVGFLAAIFVIGGIVIGIVFALTGFKSSAPQEVVDGSNFDDLDITTHDLDDKQRWGGGQRHDVPRRQDGYGAST